jgi:hypothetical protein
MPRPVYWKPQHPTRVMRERAFARRQRAQDEARRRPAGPSLLDRLRKLLPAAVRR